MKVSYKLKKGFNIKKNIESFEAIEILIMEGILMKHIKTIKTRIRAKES